MGPGQKHLVIGTAEAFKLLLAENIGVAVPLGEEEAVRARLDIGVHQLQLGLHQSAQHGVHRLRVIVHVIAGLFDAAAEFRMQCAGVKMVGMTGTVPW